MLALIVILYAVFAGTFSLGKALLVYAPPFFIVGTRMFIAGSLMLSYQLCRSKFTLKLSKKDLLDCIQLALFSIFIPYILRAWGLVYMSSSRACLLYNMGPFVSCILAYFLATEKITRTKISGLIIGFTALLPLIMTPRDASVVSLTSTALLPELAIIFSVSSLSYGWIVLRRLVKDRNHSPMLVNGIAMAMGGFGALVTSYSIETVGTIEHIWPFVGMMATIIILSNFVGHTMYAMLLRQYSPTFLALGSFLSPLFAGLFGWLFLQEQLTWQFYTATCGIFIGLFLFHRSEQQLEKSI